MTDLLDSADDGFGNLLVHCGSYYHDHPEASLPAGVIRGNYAGALAFVFGHWHEPRVPGPESRFYIPNGSK